MPRPIVHTDPALRDRTQRLIGRTQYPSVEAAPMLLVEAVNLIGALAARIEELEALARTPRLANEEDARRYNREMQARCSTCHKWIVYDPEVDVRMRTDTSLAGFAARPDRRRYIVCPCGAERTLALV